MTFKVHRTLFSNQLLILILTVFSLFSCSQEGSEKAASTNPSSTILTTTVLKDSVRLIPAKGLVFYKKKPFTGTSIERTGEVITESIDYVNGKKHGFYRKWFPNGMLSFEAKYYQNKRDGYSKTWWSNGNQRSEANFVKGIGEGVQLQWYKSGSKFKRIQLVNGREEGLQQSWRENGKLYNNYEAKNGRIFGLKRANLCYELDDEAIKYKDR